jgi:hypothetical protein
VSNEEKRVKASAATCAHCGGPLEEGATVCFRCGAPISDIETPTQPVPAPRSLRTKIVTEVTVSIEPDPGAPAPAAQGAPVATPPVGPTPAPPLPTQPTVLARITSVITSVIAPGRVNRLSLVLLGISVVVIIVGIVVLNYRLIPSAVPAQTVYRDPMRRFYFTQPTLWQTTTTAEGVRLDDSAGFSSAVIAVTYPQTGEDAAQAADSLALNLGIGSSSPVRVANTTWERRSGTVRLADGTTRELVVLVALHNGQLYILEFSSLAATFPSTNTLVYQPLLRSFTFG